MESSARMGKMTRQKNMLRIRKRFGEKSEARPYQDLSKTWFSPENQFMQLEGQYAKTGPSRAFLGINQQMKLHEVAPLPYNNVTTLFSPSGHTSSPANPLTMTPQEKIKKLRQRQQLRAMLAIQKQQKQFGHQTSESEHPICPKHTVADQMQPIGGNLEVDNGTSTILTLDTNSPLVQDYSGTVSMATDDCSAEIDILYRLQDIVAKLDVQLRLYIRDNLCRLAQSATQRQCAKDTSSIVLTTSPENWRSDLGKRRLDRMNELVGNVKVADGVDFGAARVKAQAQPRVMTVETWTYRWMAP